MNWLWLALFVFFVLGIVGFVYVVEYRGVDEELSEEPESLRSVEP